MALIFGAIFFAQILRNFSIHREETKAKAIAIRELKVSSLVEKDLKVEIQDYLRGDYKVSLGIVPYSDLRWTVNTVTGQMIPWQGPKKEGSVLRSLR